MQAKNVGKSQFHFLIDKMVNVGEDFCHRGLFRIRCTPEVSGLCDGVTDLSASRLGERGGQWKGQLVSCTPL